MKYPVEIIHPWGEVSTGFFLVIWYGWGIGGADRYYNVGSSLYLVVSFSPLV